MVPVLVIMNLSKPVALALLSHCLRPHHGASHVVFNLAVLVIVHLQRQHALARSEGHRRKAMHVLAPTRQLKSG